MSRKFIIELQESPEGDLILEFPQEIVDELGLMEGDVLRYELEDDGLGFRMFKEEKQRVARSLREKTQRDYERCLKQN